MADDVSYVKLVTGEDLFGVARELPTGDLVLDQPMVMETVHSQEEGGSIMFMARYAPFSRERTVLLPASRVMLKPTPAPDSLCRHYQRSLDYCVAMGDKSFDEGIAKATEFIEDTLDSLNAERPASSKSLNPDETPDSFRERLMASAFLPPSETKH